LFIIQVIYEHGEPRWNDITREKLLIRPPKLSGNHTSRVIIAKQVQLGEGNDEFGLTNDPFRISRGFFNMPLNLTTWDRRLYFFSEGRRAADFDCP
jgi:hypothetical protein